MTNLGVQTLQIHPFYPENGTIVFLIALKFILPIFVAFLLNKRAALLNAARLPKFNPSQLPV